MSEKLDETAMQFCRECIGWNDAVLYRDGHWDDCEPVIFRKGAGDKDSLYYTDLNSVMRRVRGWMDSDQDLRLDITEYNVVATVRLDRDLLADVRCLDSENETICQALLEACVEASRRLEQRNRV